MEAVKMIDKDIASFTEDRNKLDMRIDNLKKAKKLLMNGSVEKKKSSPKSKGANVPLEEALHKVEGVLKARRVLSGAEIKEMTGISDYSYHKAMTELKKGDNPKVKYAGKDGTAKKWEYIGSMLSTPPVMPQAEMVAN